MVGEVQERCLRSASSGDRIGAPCGNCGHTNLVHGNNLSDVEACPICDSIIAQQVFANLIESMAEALGAAPGSVTIPRQHINHPPPKPPLRCKWTAVSTGARCQRSINHSGGHSYKPGFMEARPYSWRTPDAHSERVSPKQAARDRESGAIE